MAINEALLQLGIEQLATLRELSWTLTDWWMTSFSWPMY